ncbi:hypothetical protein ABZP36_035834 [Zizania latifolia]
MESTAIAASRGSRTRYGRALATPTTALAWTRGQTALEILQELANGTATPRLPQPLGGERTVSMAPMAHRWRLDGSSLVEPPLVSRAPVQGMVVNSVTFTVVRRQGPPDHSIAVPPAGPSFRSTQMLAWPQNAMSPIAPSSTLTQMLAWPQNAMRPAASSTSTQMLAWPQNAMPPAAPLSTSTQMLGWPQNAMPATVASAGQRHFDRNGVRVTEGTLASQEPPCIVTPVAVYGDGNPLACFYCARVFAIDSCEIPGLLPPPGFTYPEPIGPTPLPPAVYASLRRGAPPTEICSDLYHFHLTMQHMPKHALANLTWWPLTENVHGATVPLNLMPMSATTSKHLALLPSTASGLPYESVMLEHEDMVRLTLGRPSAMDLDLSL